MPTPPDPPMGSPDIALVDESGNIDFGDLQDAADALQTQTVRDLLPTWDVAATVTAYETVEDVPDDAILVTILTGPLPDPNATAMGYHGSDTDGPFAKIVYTADWTISVSHEILELLVDPDTNDGTDFSTFRKIRLTLPDADRTVVDALVEICDAVESGDPSVSSYTIDGIAVANFVWPSWYEPDVSAEIDVYGNELDYTEMEFVKVDVFAQATEVQPPADECIGLVDLPGGIYQQFELDPTKCINKTVELDIEVQCTQFEIDVLNQDEDPCESPQIRITGGPDDVDFNLYRADAVGNVFTVMGLKPGTYHIDVTCFDSQCADFSLPVDERDVVVLEDEITTVTSTTDCPP